MAQCRRRCARLQDVGRSVAISERGHFQMNADVELDGVREHRAVGDHAEGRPPDLAPDHEVRNLDPTRLVHATVPQGGVEVLRLGDAADPECAVDNVVRRRERLDRGAGEAFGRMVGGVEVSVRAQQVGLVLQRHLDRAGVDADIDVRSLRLIEVEQKVTLEAREPALDGEQPERADRELQAAVALVDAVERCGQGWKCHGEPQHPEGEDQPRPDFRPVPAHVVLPRVPSSSAGVRGRSRIR